MQEKAVVLQRFISERELEALARIFGTEGINYLVEELLLKQGVIKELAALRQQQIMSQKSNSCQSNILLDWP